MKKLFTLFICALAAVTSAFADVTYEHVSDPTTLNGDEEVILVSSTLISGTVYQAASKNYVYNGASASVWNGFEPISLQTITSPKLTNNDELPETLTLTDDSNLLKVSVSVSGETFSFMIISDCVVTKGNPPTAPGIGKYLALSSRKTGISEKAVPFKYDSEKRIITTSASVFFAFNGLTTMYLAGCSSTNLGSTPTFYKKVAGGEDPTPVVTPTKFTLTEGSTAALWKDNAGTPEKVQDITDGLEFNFKADDIAADAKYYIVAEGTNIELTEVKDASNQTLTINNATAAFGNHNYVEITAGEASTAYTITTATIPTYTEFTLSGGPSAVLSTYQSGMKEVKPLTSTDNKYDFSEVYQWDTYYLSAPEGYLLVSVTDGEGNELRITRNTNYFPTNYVSFTAHDAKAAKKYVVDMIKGEYVNFTVNVEAENPEVKVYRNNFDVLVPKYNWVDVATLKQGANTVSIIDDGKKGNGLYYAIGAYGSDVLSSVTDAEGKELKLINSSIADGYGYTLIDMPAAGASYTVHLTRDYIESTITVSEDNALTLYGWDKAEGKYTEVKALTAGENACTFEIHTNYALVAAENKKFYQVTDADNAELTVTLPTAEGALFTTEYVVLEAGKLSTAYNVEFAAGGISSTINVNKADAVVLYAMNMDTREYTVVKTLERGENHFTFNDDTNYAFVAAEGEYFTDVTANGEYITFVNPEEETDPVFTTTYVILQAGAIAENYDVTVYEEAETTEAHSVAFNFADFASLGVDLEPTYPDPYKQYDLTQDQTFVSADGAIEVSFGVTKPYLTYPEEPGFFSGLNVTTSGWGANVKMGTMTIKTVNSYAYLEKIVIDMQAGTWSKGMDADKGTITALAGGSQTWTASVVPAGAPAFAPAFAPANDYTNEVTFTINATTQIKNMQVGYFDVTTGLETVENVEMVEAKYYDLQGRRVLRPAGGIFVRVAGNKVDKVAIR